MTAGLYDSISLERRGKMVIMLKIALRVCAAWMQKIIGFQTKIKQSRQVR